MLRGVAILFVLLNHVNMRLRIGGVPYGQTLPRQVLDTLVWSGQYGVQMFFAVSGFLIASASLRRWGSLPALRPGVFYQLRFARIAPPLLLLLAVLWVLDRVGSPWFVVPERLGGVGAALSAVLTFHVNVLEARRGYLPASWDVLWSLSVEEMFYLGFPVMCRLLRRRRWLILSLTAFVAIGPLARTILAGGNELWHEYSYLGATDAIAMGCLTALWAPARRLSRGALAALRTVGAGLVVFILAFSMLVERLGLARLGLDMTVIALGTCLVMAAMTQAPPRIPRWARAFAWFGRRSYEIYLTHMFVVIGLYVLFRKLAAPAVGVPLLFVCTVLLAGLLGEVIARVYSEPMNRFLRRRWGAGPRQAGAVIDDRAASAPASEPAALSGRR